MGYEESISIEDTPYDAFSEGSISVEDTPSIAENTSEQSLWDTANAFCKDLSDEVGGVTGDIYEYGAGKVTAGIPGVAEEIGDTVGGFVENNWPNVCDLPENISNDVSKLFSDTSGQISIDPVEPNTSCIDCGTPSFDTPSFSSSSGSSFSSGSSGHFDSSGSSGGGSSGGGGDDF